jgi:shikimate kinase
MKRIILIGYMGAGKTTLGKKLAKAMGLTFFDLDWFIENRFCTTVSKLFEERGEEGFRKIEKEMLHEVGEFENVVIAAGGGTPCFFDNIAFMNEKADTIYLKASPEVLYSHLNIGRQKRPLLADKSDEEVKAFIVESLKKREPYYMQARHIVNIDLLTSNRRVQEAVDRIISIVQQETKQE